MTHEEIIEKAKQLIAIPTIAGNTKAMHEAVNLVTDIISRYEGITVERLERAGVPSLLAYVGDTRPEHFDVIFNAHLDVVPAQPEEFVPRLEGNKFFGRGVYDMKLAALLMTEVFCQNAPSLPLALGLQITTDEETGGYNGVVYHLEQGVTADFVVTGEMTDLGICNESRGLCWVEIAFEGKSAHGGWAWEGNNAVIRASDFARALTQRFPVPKKKEWVATASISSINTTNHTFNKVPDNATLRVDFRFIPEDHEFDTKKSVEAMLASIDPSAKVVNFQTFEPAVYVPRSNPQLQAFTQAYRAATGKQPQLIRRYASSDGRHFQLYGIPCIEFGLSGWHHHADNEYVDLSSVTPFKTTLEKFLHDYPRNPEQARGHADGHRATRRK